MRAGLRALLGARGGFEVLDSEAAQESADVVIAVGVMAAGSYCAAPIVALVETANEAQELVGKEGIAALLSADADGDQVAAAVVAAAAGLNAVSPSLALLGEQPRTAQSPAVRGGELTAREIDVLALIADGLPNKTIATRLGISENTVKFHVGSILGKLGAASRAEAVMLAARQGLLTV